jgi:hypothetical protein
MATGRTVGKFSKFQINDAGTTEMRDIPVTSYGSVGLTYAEVDVTALQDAITNVFNGQGTFGVTITGPFDNSVVTSGSVTTERPRLSGSHTVLEPLNGGVTPKSFGIYLGIQGDWAAGDPVFGAVASVLVSSYLVDPAAGTYSCKLVTAGNRSISDTTPDKDPHWGSAQIDATS